MTTWNGMTIAATKIKNSILESLVLDLTNTQPDIAAVMDIKSNDVTVMKTEETKDDTYLTFGLVIMTLILVQSCPKLDGHPIGFCTISADVFAELIMTIINGPMKIRNSNIVSTSAIILFATFFFITSPTPSAY